MTGKKQILDNELLKEIVSIRLSSLHHLLQQRQMGLSVDIDEEGATGKYDNKGAIFIPGGLVYQDVDERFIRYDSYGSITGSAFRKRLREAMRNDNATLLYPDGIASSINLDSGFFSKAARRIFTYKKAAWRQTMKIGNGTSIEVNSDDIIKSHCPTYLKPPYGARTRISTCVSVGLIEPPMFYAYYRAELNFSEKQARRFVHDLDRARESPHSSDGKVLYPPHIVVCHSTRYKENNFVGLTRILGIGKFGEFATLTFEALTRQLANEMKRRHIAFKPEDVFAQCDNVPILGLLRTYERTNPGRRSLKYQLCVINPQDDAAIDPARLGAAFQSNQPDRA